MADRIAKRIKKLKRSIIKNSKRMQRLKSKKRNEVSDFVNLMKTELVILKTKNYNEYLIESNDETGEDECNNIDEFVSAKYSVKGNDKKVMENKNIPIDKKTIQVIDKNHNFEKSAKESLKEISEINPLCNIKSDIDGRVWESIVYWCKILFFDEIKP